MPVFQYFAEYISNRQLILFSFVTWNETFRDLIPNSIKLWSEAKIFYSNQWRLRSMIEIIWIGNCIAISQLINNLHFLLKCLSQPPLAPGSPQRSQKPSLVPGPNGADEVSLKPPKLACGVTSRSADSKWVWCLLCCLLSFLFMPIWIRELIK